jgi:MFS family permease
VGGRPARGSIAERRAGAGTAGGAPAARRVTRWSSAAMALHGLVGASWGALLVPVAATFHLGLLATGSLFAVRGAAGAAGSALAGWLSERWPRHALVTGYGLGALVGLGVAALAGSWWAVLAGAAGASAAFGGISTETAALTAVAAAGRRGRDLSLINAVYAIGAGAGPLAAGALLAVHVPWRAAVLLWAALAPAVLLPLGRAARGLARTGALPGRGGAGTRPLTSFWRALPPEALLLWALSFTYNGVGWTIVGWSATWLVRRFGAVLLLGAGSATVFYAFLTLGRLANAWLADRVDARGLLAAETLLTAAGLAACALVRTPLGAMAAFALTGLAMGGIYPNVQARAVGMVPDRPGALTASVSMAGAAGTMTVPALTGTLGSSAAAMGSMLFWAAVAAALGSLVVWTGRAGGARRAATG